MQNSVYQKREEMMKMRDHRATKEEQASLHFFVFLDENWNLATVANNEEQDLNGDFMEVDNSHNLPDLGKSYSVFLIK